MSRYKKLSETAVRLGSTVIGGHRGGTITQADYNASQANAQNIINSTTGGRPGGQYGDINTPGASVPPPTDVTPGDSFFIRYKKPLLIGGSLLVAAVAVYFIFGKKKKRRK